MPAVTTVDGESLAVGAVYGIGRNYREHAKELNNPVPSEPVVFLKVPASVRGLEPAPLAFDEAFHHEVELVLRVGRPVPLRGPGSWEDVSHVALGLDLTRRAVQTVCKQQGLPWTTAKSFAGSAVVGPLLQRHAVGDPARLTFTLSIGGTLRQTGALTDMLFDVPTILHYLASLAPLHPGDLVFTGTPSGVGPIRGGDPFALVLVGAHTQWSFDGVL